MIDAIQFFLKNQLKFANREEQNSGFTLIELLVAMIIAFIVITPVLGFMINVMKTDKQEQAKATSEQDLQTAIDYINQDLQQAVYIYDNDALNRNSSTTAAQSGIKNQIPQRSGGANGCPASVTVCEPVLVFWKRNLVDSATRSTTQTNTTVGSLTGGNDTFVYSLVAYYLIEGANGSWSDVARIGRFEVSDGIRSTTGDGNNNGYHDAFEPDSGFALFDLQKSGNLKTKMNQWTKATANFPANSMDILVDYIDVTNSGADATVTCNTSTEQQVPADNTPANTTDAKKYSNFVACVDSEKGTVRVFIRGNALARVNITTKAARNKYQKARDSFFPVVSTQVKGRGFLFVK